MALVMSMKLVVLKLLSALRHLKHFLLPKMVAVHFFLLNLLSVQILLSLLMHEPLNVLLLLIMLLLLMLKKRIIIMLHVLLIASSSAEVLLLVLISTSPTLMMRMMLMWWW